MAYKIGVVLIALFVGSLAIPSQAPAEDEPIDYFIHSDLNARIVGGGQAAAGSAPHSVALTTGTIFTSFLCGGSIIGQRHILTAAHCINAVYSRGSLSSSLRATVGTNRWNRGGTTYRLARNITHPHYLQRNIKNDIGVLITTANIVTTNLIQPIALNFDHINPGVEVKVAGWGRTRAGGSFSANLLELTLSTINEQRCVAEVAQASITFNQWAPPVEPHIELCTFHSAGHGTCNGDSGSALVRVSNQQQIGLVSWGFPCARGAPDMFVRLSAFQDFLRTALA